MKKDAINTNFPEKKWLPLDWLYLAGIIFASALLTMSGLSVRSLWGSEGRWAEIAREMLFSGNYFLPTINGYLYFDKPLLSYWAIIPFSINGTVTEISARMPGAMAGIGAIVITFIIGRRLFESRTGIISSALLLTSAMFVFWSRTASAETINVFAIWLSFLFFICGANSGSTLYVVLLFSVSAVSSFCKGPVAPAVVFFSITFYSIFETILELRQNKLTLSELKKVFFSKFRWILSLQGLAGVLTGIVIFITLLLLPVITTGSWSSAELMWKENVQRFFQPFDHIEPFYIYFKYVPVFFAPWTLFLIVSLFCLSGSSRKPAERFVLFITLGIFVFFTISGSRRSYYILPILPGLALLTGKTISDWIGHFEQYGERALKWSMTLVCSIFILGGICLIYAFFDTRIPSHPSQLAIGVLVIISCIYTMMLFKRKMGAKGILFLISIVFIIELWIFNVGMAVAEQKRTLRPFATKTAEYLKDVSDERISIYQGYDSIFIFYLNRKPLKMLSSAEDIRSFQKMHKNGFLIGNLALINKFMESGEVKGISLIYAEKEVTNKHGDNLALFSLNK